MVEEVQEQKVEEIKDEVSGEEPQEAEEASSSKLVDDAVNAAKELREATAEMKKETDRRAELDARMVLGGRAEAGVPQPKKERLSDTEYAEAMERGEVNPFAEDGVK